MQRARRALQLLLPEWQGYGLSAAPAAGARALAARLFAEAAATVVDAPEEERLTIRDGVLGLDSIAARAVRARAAIQAFAPDRIFTIGATCGVEIAPIGYLNERLGGDLAVLWLDGHADLNTPASSPSGHFHGMVLRSLLGDGPPAIVNLVPRPLSPTQVFLIGARDFDPPELTYVASAGIAVMDANPDQVLALVRERGFNHVYVHFDLDIVNPNDFHSALMRAPEGPSLTEVEALIRSICETFPVAGASVVEYVERDAAEAERLCEVVRRTGLFGDQ